MTGTDFEKNKSKRRLCFYTRVGIHFPCGMEEAKLILVAKRVSERAGIQEWRDYSNWQLSQHTCGRKWTLKVSLVFSKSGGLATSVLPSLFNGLIRAKGGGSASCLGPAHPVHTK